MESELYTLQDVISELLVLDKPVIVEFEKVDGTTRRLVCTRNPKLVTENYEVFSKKSNSPKEKNDYVMAVWDLENHGWRSFRHDSVKTVDVA